MVEAIYHFPPDFRWGVATAAYQVEGNTSNSQWWAWEQQEARIANGERSGLACNWWANAEADFDTAAAMGLNAMRLSVEWSRIEISPGRIDTAALDRYREMLRGLRERGIEPMVTLHHFSDPLWLAQQGGWQHIGAIAYYVRFVEVVVKALGEYATLWCTFNEPNLYAHLGYLDGRFPPGKSELKTTASVLKTMLAAHGRAYRVIHELQPQAQVGLAHHIRLFDPSRAGSIADRAIAWLQDRAFNETVLRAVWDGRWSLPIGFGFALGLRRTLDWIGVNYYTRDTVKLNRHAPSQGFGDVVRPETAELLEGGYGELYPQGLARALKRVGRMGIPIYITENGIPDHDDRLRPRALLLHLHQMWRMIQYNTPVKGYYHWTLTDNFEWAEGWRLRFGLIELDPASQRRTPRPSADLYAAIARGNALTAEMVGAYAPDARATLFPE